MKLGVLGGTFDPPHVGHLVLADQCASALDLQRVLFVPAFLPPHKLDSPLTPFDRRLRMVELAIEGDSRWVASAMERDRDTVSYTVDTLAALHAEQKPEALWLLLGEDSLADLRAWKDPERIVALCHLAVYRRERAGRDPVGAAPDWVMAAARFVEGPLIDVSSTQIRERLARGGSVRHLIPAPVLELIEREGLYREPRTGRR